MTDSAGNVCYDADFYPFGGERAYVNTCPQNYKFTGYERDPESNLDYASARYNSSTIGRFMSPDPVGNFVANPANPQTWNMYSYVTNNPLSMIDPTGMDECFNYTTSSDTGHAGTGPNPPGNEAACVEAGGTWVISNQTVYATASIDYYAPVIVSPQFQSVTTPNWLSPFANLRSPQTSSRTVCAANLADKYSIAGALGTTKKKGLFANAFNGMAGNFFSGAVFALHPGLGNKWRAATSINNLTFGGTTAAVNAATDAAPITELGLSEAVGGEFFGASFGLPVTIAKGVYDLASFGASYYECGKKQ